MGNEPTRRTHRISLSVPVRVTGTDVNGQNFVEGGRTLTVNRYGGSILLHRKLAPEQEVTVQCLATNQESEALVVGQVGKQHDGIIYGVALATPGGEFWGIEFPHLDEADESVTRLLLQCCYCRSMEIAYLNELETEIFEATHRLSRPCKSCNASTLWQVATHDLPPEPPPPLPKIQPPPPPPPTVRSENERRNIRIKLAIKMCIRHPEMGEEILASEDASRGGFCFQSQKEYARGAPLDVAIPYDAESANIFVPARIVHVQKLPEEGRFRYGAAYMKGQEPWSKKMKEPAT